MATYKSEALHQTLPAPAAAALALRARPAAAVGPDDARRGWPTGCCGIGPLARLAKAAAGVDQRRGLPAFSEEPLRSSRRSRTSRPLARLDAVDVWVWADSFTDRFAADTGRAAVRLLEGAGSGCG